MILLLKQISGIRAIGDLIHGPMLAHKAEEDGVVCAEIISGQSGHVNYELVPGVIYVDPEIANVGLTEAQAKERNIMVRTGSFPMAANGRARQLVPLMESLRLLLMPKQIVAWCSNRSTKWL